MCKNKYNTNTTYIIELWDWNLRRQLHEWKMLLFYLLNILSDWKIMYTYYLKPIQPIRHYNVNNIFFSFYITRMFKWNLSIKLALNMYFDIYSWKRNLCYKNIFCLKTIRSRQKKYPIEDVITFYYFIHRINYVTLSWLSYYFI